MAAARSGCSSERRAGGRIWAATTAVVWGLAVLMGGTGGCQTTLMTINIDRSSTTTVQGGNLFEDWLDVFGFADFLDMDLTDAQELKNQGVAPGDIKRAHLVRFELEAKSPADADLSFLSEMSLYVSAPDLPKVLLAHADSFPAGQAIVPFQVEGVDLTRYITSKKLTLTTEVKAHHPRDDTKVEARFRLQLDVTAQGATSQL